jgi:hypothetical protein
MGKNDEELKIELPNINPEELREKSTKYLQQIQEKIDFIHAFLDK